MLICGVDFTRSWKEKGKRLCLYFYVSVFLVLDFCCSNIKTVADLMSLKFRILVRYVRS